MARANYDKWQKINVAVLDALIAEPFCARGYLVAQVVRTLTEEGAGSHTTKARVLFAIDRLLEYGAIRVYEIGEIRERDAVTLNLSSGGLRKIADVYSGAYEGRTSSRDRL